MKVLCKLGLHKYGKEIKRSDSFQSNVFECRRECLRCGKVKRYVKPKND